MPEPSENETPQRADAAEFERLTRKARASGPLAELWYFLGRSRKWWMAPILLMLLLVGTLLVMAGTAVGPFIYALF